MSRVKAVCPPPLSLGERVLRELDARPTHCIACLAAVVVIAPNARQVIASQWTTSTEAIRSAFALLVELAMLGERNAGVVVITALFRPDTSQSWPPTADHRWLVADVAAAIAVARFVAWLDEIEHAKPKTSQLERFAQGLSRGLGPDHAAAVATGRVQ